MSPRLPLLPPALLAGLLLAAPQAEARFGKSSDNTQESNSNTHDATPVQSSPTHDASPVRDSTPVHDASPVVESPRYEPPPPPPPPPTYYEETPPPTYYAEPPPPTYYAEEPAGVALGTSEEYKSRRYKNFVFGFDMQVMSAGSAAGLHVGGEGEEFGFMLRAGELTLKADDGSAGTDSIGLLETHLSWAVAKGRNGRLRLDAGMNIAKAPDITFVGPMVGTSAEYYLADSFAVEARVHVTPIPYRQMDAAGGVAWYMLGNLVALRGGLRMLVLDDAGKLDGVVHRDVFTGPYFSLGLAL